MFKKLLVLCLLIGLASCSSRIAQNTTVSASTAQPKKNQIIFLSLELSKAENGIGFDILDTKLVDGKLKRGMPSELNIKEYLLFEFQDSEGQTLTTVASENPLSRSVEVANDQGKFERKQVDLDKVSLVLRIQFNTKMTRVKISDNAGKELSLLPLKL